MIDYHLETVRGNKSIGMIRLREYIYIIIASIVHGNKAMSLAGTTRRLDREYDEPLVRRLIEKVTIYADKFTVDWLEMFLR